MTSTNPHYAAVRDRAVAIMRSPAARLDITALTLPQLLSGEHQNDLVMAIGGAISLARHGLAKGRYIPGQQGALVPFMDNLTPADLDLMHEDVLAVLASNAANPPRPRPGLQRDRTVE